MWRWRRLFEGTGFVSGAKSSVKDALQVLWLSYGLKELVETMFLVNIAKRIGPMENLPRVVCSTDDIPQRAQYPLAHITCDIVDAPRGPLTADLFSHHVKSSHFLERCNSKRSATR
jgi:hypothetical protein